MKQYPEQVSVVNTMRSEEFEIFHVRDVIDPTKTLYHTHDFYEIHMTLKGKAHFFLNGEQFDIEPGSVLLIQANDTHRIMTQNTDYYERVYIFVTDFFLKKHSTQQTNLEACFKSSLGGKKSKVLKIDPKELIDFAGYIDHHTEKGYGNDLLVEQQILQLLVHLNKEAFKVENIIAPNEDYHNLQFEEMVTYITDNLSSPLSLEWMEKQFFLNRYQIIREFKKNTGMTFHQFVLEKRLLLAKSLLRERGNATEIYQLCGFNSYTNFLKAFKKAFGITPKEFIRGRNREKIHFVHFEEEEACTD